MPPHTPPSPPPQDGKLENTEPQVAMPHASDRARAGEHADAPMGSPRISIALSTYNGARHLREQLDSYARQTLLPCELAATDDQSSDATIAILEDFARTAPFPVHIHVNPQRLGFAENFMKATRLCSGDLIAFSDQDDVWLEEKLAVSAKYFRDPDLWLTVHSARKWYGDDRDAGLYPHFPQTEIIGPGTLNPFEFIPGFAVLIRRELVSIGDWSRRPGNVCGGETMAHDQWFWFVATSIGKIALISDVLTLYRQHMTNTVGAPKRRTLAAKVRASLQRLEYTKMAEIERECVEALEIIRQAHGARWSHQLDRTANRLRKRERLHRLRARLYSADAGLLGRATTFLQILARGGYFSDAQQDRFGPASALKDLSIAVPGFHLKLLRQQSALSD